MAKDKIERSVDLLKSGEKIGNIYHDDDDNEAKFYPADSWSYSLEDLRRISNEVDNFHKEAK